MIRQNTVQSAENTWTAGENNASASVNIWPNVVTQTQKTTMLGANAPNTATKARLQIYLDSIIARCRKLQEYRAS